ncbi:ComEC/Rec2 family competence protein [Nocardioides salsibiostraticola]
MTGVPETTEERATDLRMPLLGLAAWAGALTASLGPYAVWVLGASGLFALVVVRRPRRRGVLTVVGCLLVFAATLGTAMLRQHAAASGPVGRWAQERAVVSVVGTVVSDPRTVPGRFAPLEVVRLKVETVTGRGQTFDVRSQVLVLGGPAWHQVDLGSRVETTARLAAADDAELAALLPSARDPTVVSGPSPWWRGAAAVRASIRDAVSHRPQDQRALVPALVDGDDAGLDEQLEQDFRTTGLTHLTAVSGTNLTLVVGFLLVLARWVGVRGRWLLLVGALGIAGFILLARTEPSVVRAAAMGAVGLLAMGLDGRQRALRGLGVAVVGLLLIQPQLSTSVGFTLSVLATAGIVLLGPGCRDALATWVPRWFAEAVAVPLAAQVACTPVIAAISGQISLVAVAANLLVAPVVGPTTVLGLAGGLLGLVSDRLGQLCGTLAGWSVSWIVLIAERGADLPGAAVDWGTSALALSALVGLTMVGALLTPHLLRRRVLTLCLAAVLVLVLLARLPAVPGFPGWPGGLPGGVRDDDWVAAMCDVGQGDALVLNAGSGQAVLIDAGPDPDAVDRCLDTLGVTALPLVVLTHFHADHVDGLTGALRGREIGAIETTRMLDPTSGVEEVQDTTTAAGQQTVAAAYGQSRRTGDVVLQVLWPLDGSPTSAAGDGTAANDASVVLLAVVRGVRILLTGDLEPPGQGVLAKTLPDLRVDVLKVPHHGSRYQDLDWLRSLRAETVLVSVGEDNDYGHPATEVLDALAGDGATVARTDLDGLVLVGTDGVR